ncbi:MAG: penicillin-binding transpeptidase domain-containing protein [Ilumatobacteraceae bacterium]
MAVDKRTARLGVLALVGTLLFGLVGARLWFLQTVQQEELQAEVDVTKLRTVPLLPERGRIFDADGRILADNERVLTIGVEWEVIRRKSDRDEIFRRLSGWIGVSVEDMEERFTSNVYSPFLPMPVAEDVDEPTAIAIQERVEDLPGVVVIEESRRVYPYAPLASHIVGYMGRITAETKDRYTDAGYNLNERVGQFGIELSMEEPLHGRWGYVTYEVDNASRIVREVERVPAVDGNDIQLTIDLDQQQYAEQALESQLKLRRLDTAKNPIDTEATYLRRVFEGYPGEVYFKAPAGAAVVMNYETGHVIALASYPTFDNRWFESDLGGGKFEEIFPSVDENGDPIDPDESILVNRAIQGRYNLGSTFKPFTAYAALNTGLLSTNDYYTDRGTYRMTSVEDYLCDSGLVRCVYKNAKCGNGRPCVYGTVDTETALAVSSDAFFYRVGELMMTENDFQPVLQEQVRSFGFGSDTGIDLPFEFDGTVPDAELKARYAELGVISEGEGEGYFTGDNVQLAIGQGLLSATPLQLAVGYSTIANYGFVMKPEIIKAIYEPGVPDSATPGFADVSQGRLAEEPNVDGEVVRQISMSTVIRDEINRGLTRVIRGPGHTSDFYHRTTGENLFRTYPGSAIPIAGKTGTAQGAGNYPWNDSSAFAAYSQDPDRPYTVSAYLEKAGYGARGAGPVVKCMFQQLSGLALTDPVVLSDPLDTESDQAAPSKRIPDSSCYSGALAYAG